MSSAARDSSAARRLDVKEFAQCADVGCSDAGRYCSVVLPSAVRPLALVEVMGAVGGIASTRCRSYSPVRCRLRFSTTRRIAVGTAGREPIAVGVTAAAATGDPALVLGCIARARDMAIGRALT